MTGNLQLQAVWDCPGCNQKQQTDTEPGVWGWEECDGGITVAVTCQTCGVIWEFGAPNGSGWRVEKG